jgi:hypothetical protein
MLTLRLVQTHPQFIERSAAATGILSREQDSLFGDNGAGMGHWVQGQPLPC